MSLGTERWVFGGMAKEECEFVAAVIKVERWCPARGGQMDSEQLYCIKTQVMIDMICCAALGRVIGSSCHSLQIRIPRDAISFTITTCDELIT